MNYDQQRRPAGPAPLRPRTGLKTTSAGAQGGAQEKSSAPSATRLQLDHVSPPKSTGPKVLNTEDVSVQDGWQVASDANADCAWPARAEPHFTYDDEDNM